MQNISCVQNFTSTHLYLEQHAWNMRKKHFLKENLCVLKVFLCALISRPVCSVHAQLRGNITLSPFNYFVAKGVFSCRSISMEWSPLWAAFRADGPPFQILHLSQVLHFCPWLGWERLRVVVSWTNEWMNEYIIYSSTMHMYIIIIIYFINILLYCILL